VGSNPTLSARRLFLLRRHTAFTKPNASSTVTVVSLCLALLGLELEAHFRFLVCGRLLTSDSCFSYVALGAVEQILTLLPEST
jgi:hypothetical protein